jgi:hypothetical protein
MGKVKLSPFWITFTINSLDVSTLGLADKNKIATKNNLPGCLMNIGYASNLMCLPLGTNSSLN